MREILKELMDQHHDDAYSLERKSGVPQPTTHRFLKGLHKSANEATVKKWADAYNISPSQLRGDLPIEKNSTELSSLDVIRNYSKTIRIPLLMITASMGLGETLYDDERVIDMLSVSTEWAERALKPFSNVKNLAFIHAIGDSMHPTFNDGDVLLVDTADKSVTADKIYVLEAHQRLFIKRVRQRLDGVFEISSDNPAVKTVDILTAANDVEIKGRVLWVWNGRKV